MMIFDFKPEVRSTVFVIGDLILDHYISGNSQRISPEAPVPVVDVSNESFTLGGCANVAANLASLGTEVHIMSVVGSDESADIIKKMASNLDINLSGVIATTDRKTSRKTRVLVGQQQIVRFDVETKCDIGASQQNQLLETFRKKITCSSVDAVILSDYGKGSLPKALIRNIIDLCREMGILILCDPKGIDFSRYYGCTALTPNRLEAGLAAKVKITDDKTLKFVGQKLLKECGLSFLIITLSGDGIALFFDEEMRLFPVKTRDIFDVSGAGDTVIASLTLALCKGLDMAKACEIANIAAGIVVSKPGTATVSVNDIMEFNKPSSTRIKTKIVSLADLVQQVDRLRSSGKQIVFTNGCFDLIHAGHVLYLEKASTFGDILIVALNADESVKRLKGGGRPINQANDRAIILGSLSSVDYIVIFEEDTPLKVLSKVLPDVLVKGSDYTVSNVIGADMVQKYGGRVELVDLVEGRSSTNLIDQIENNKGRDL